MQRKITIILLVLYWPALFILAHIPIPQSVCEADVSDKSLHLFAYLILVFLLWFAVSGDKKVSWRRGTTWWVLFIIVVYAIFDEWLQGRMPGRICDVKDFFADMAGTLTGLILFSFLSFWPAGLLVAGTVIFGITNIARTSLADFLPVPNAIFHLFGYAIFTMLWIQNMQLFLPTIHRPGIKYKWLIASLAAPTVLLFTVKFFSVILGKGFSAKDVIIAVIAIATVVVITYMTASLVKRQE
jgi:VanZ family protein